MNIVVRKNRCTFPIRSQAQLLYGTLCRAVKRREYEVRISVSTIYYRDTQYAMRIHLYSDALHSIVKLCHTSNRVHEHRLRRGTIFDVFVVFVQFEVRCEFVI